MFRKLGVNLCLLAILLTAVLAVSLFIFQRAAQSASGDIPQSAGVAAPAAPSVTGTYLWSFAAKFVCGYQNPSTAAVAGEPVVKPGNYATDITIHNPNYRENPLHKKLVVLVEPAVGGGQIVRREPDIALPSAGVNLVLGADAATMDDCNALYAMSHNNTLPNAAMPLFTGYLVILSPLDLDVDVTYTAAEPIDGTVTPVSISQDTLRVTGKRIFLPAGTLP
jgi:hypothetical protein